MSQSDSGGSGPTPPRQGEPPYPGAPSYRDDDEELYNPITYERDPDEVAESPAGSPEPEPRAPRIPAGWAAADWGSASAPAQSAVPVQYPRPQNGPAPGPGLDQSESTGTYYYVPEPAEAFRPPRPEAASGTLGPPPQAQPSFLPYPQAEPLPLAGPESESGTPPFGPPPPPALPAPAWQQPPASIPPAAAAPPAAHPPVSGPPALARAPGPVARSPLPDTSWPPRKEPKRLPRWLIAAVAAVVVAGAVIGIVLSLTAGGAPKPRPAAAPRGGAAPSVSFPPPGTGKLQTPLTPTDAQAVLSQFAAADDKANAAQSKALLSGAETASSYALDSAAYTAQHAEHAQPSPAFTLVQPHLFIPLQPAAYPHWFAAQVTAQATSGAHAVLGTEYLVFTQASAGASWKEAAQPVIGKGTAQPAVAVGNDGYATAVSFNATDLSIAPSKLAQAAADSLDGHGPVSVPDDLAERQDAGYWRPRLPASTAISDSHTQTGYGILGLRTTDGGALLFYTDAAILTYQAPKGKTMPLQIPGYYSASAPVAWAGLRYMDQLATYDPRPGHGPARVVAGNSGIATKL